MLDPVAKRYQALADPKRLLVLEVLRSGERCVCDLMGVVGVQQSLLSFHLRALRDAGLVRTRRSGRWSYYSLAPDALHEMAEALAGLAEDATRVAVPVTDDQVCC